MWKLDKKNMTEIWNFVGSNEPQRSSSRFLFTFYARAALRYRWYEWKELFISSFYLFTFPTSPVLLLPLNKMHVLREGYWFVTAWMIRHYLMWYMGNGLLRFPNNGQGLPSFYFRLSYSSVLNTKAKTHTRQLLLSWPRLLGLFCASLVPHAYLHDWRKRSLVMTINLTRCCNKEKEREKETKMEGDTKVAW